jgi:hypothetical protein
MFVLVIKRKDTLIETPHVPVHTAPRTPWSTGHLNGSRLSVVALLTNSATPASSFSINNKAAASTSKTYIPNEIGGNIRRMTKISRTKNANTMKNIDVESN